MISIFGKSVYVLIAHQRTGTHYLADLLRSSGCVYQYDEVLMPIFSGKNGGDGLFFSYFIEKIKEDCANILITDYNRVDVLFGEFFRIYVDAAPSNIIGFDVKIDQLNCFPRLYGVLPQWGIKVVHLVRQNYLARVISHRIMNMRVEEGEVDIHTEKQRMYQFNLDPEEAIAWMLNDEGANSYIEHSFSQHKDLYHKITYEDINGKLRDNKIKELVNFLGSELCGDLNARTVKQNDRPLSETVTNLGEIVGLIKDRRLNYLLGGDDLL